MNCQLLKFHLLAISKVFVTRDYYLFAGFKTFKNFIVFWILTAYAYGAFYGVFAALVYHVNPLSA